MLLLFIAQPVFAASVTDGPDTLRGVFAKRHISCLCYDKQSSATLSGAISGEHASSIHHMLDSLGFFGAIIDSSSDTILLYPGQRTSIIGINVRSPIFDIHDITGPVHLPFFYDAGKVNGISSALTKRYADNGHPFASCALQIRPISENKSALEMNFEISPGDSAVFGPVLLPESTLTRNRILARELALPVGHPFSISLVQSAMNRLGQRPYIVSLSTGPLLTRKSSTVNLPDTVLVPFAISDKSGMGLDGALAYSSAGGEGLSGKAELSILNIFHFGEAIAVSYQGQTGFQSASLSSGIPRPLGMPFDLALSVAMELKANDHGSVSGELSFLLPVSDRLQCGVAIHGEELEIVDNPRSSIYGVDVLLRKTPSKAARKTWSQELSLRAGSSAAGKAGSIFPRFDMDMHAGLQIPVSRIFAFYICGYAQMLRIGQNDSLTSSEMIKLGGYGSLRGYAQDQFPVSAALWTQNELRFFFGQYGHLFIFADGGTAFFDDHLWTEQTAAGLFGYGAGVRIPIRSGILSIAYARNWRDGRDPGRIHAGITTEIASAVASMLR